MYKCGKVGDNVRVNHGVEFNHYGTITRAIYDPMNPDVWTYYVKVYNNEYFYYDDELYRHFDPNELVKELL